MEKFNEFNLKEYCNEIINNYNNMHFTDLSIEKYILKSIKNDVIGFLGDYYSLKLKCIKNSTVKVAKDEKSELQEVIHLFVKKCPPITNPNDERLIIFKKESHLYRYLLPKLRLFSLSIWLPRVYLCHDDLLILEDMRYSNGNFVHCLNQRKAKPSEIFPILKALASMHCSSLIYEERYQCRLDDLFFNCLHEISIGLNIQWFNVGLKTILEIVKHYYPLYRNNMKLLNHLEEQMKTICVMIETSKKYRNVLCHRDIWGGNILSNIDYTEVIFVDFQCCRYCPPAIDVIFTLFMNLSKDDLFKHHEEFLSFYFTELTRCFKHYHITTNTSNEANILPITQEEFYQSYNEFKLIGIVYRALAATIIHVPKTMVNDYYKLIERFTQLQTYMQENKEFRLMMLDYIQEIIDYVTSNLK